MKPSEGDVYHDQTFGSEIEVLEIDGNSVVLKDPTVGDGDYREYRLADLEHNISVGRFEKVEEKQENSKSKVDTKGEKEKSIFDF
jgi:hypothetical protein